MRLDPAEEDDSTEELDWQSEEVDDGREDEHGSPTREDKQYEDGREDEHDSQTREAEQYEDEVKRIQNDLLKLHVGCSVAPCALLSGRNLGFWVI